jgi:glycosyltransferase involved in cell wall biosynthesis
VPAGEVDALATTIAELLSDSARLEQLSAAAGRTAAEHFSWDGCGQATVAAYREVLAA